MYKVTAWVTLSSPVLVTNVTWFVLLYTPPSLSLSRHVCSVLCFMSKILVNLIQPEIYPDHFFLFLALPL